VALVERLGVTNGIRVPTHSLCGDPYTAAGTEPITPHSHRVGRQLGPQMKTLIKPLIVASFLVMCSGLVPGVDIAMSWIGFLALCACGSSGIVLLGSEDLVYESQLELIRLEHKAIQSYKQQELWDMDVRLNRIKLDHAKQMADATKKYEELELRVSKALSENRDLAARLR
jgi:hypothetical protein